MKKSLLTLAVAAAVAAPALANAEAILYGKLNVSIDYQDIDHATAAGVAAPFINNTVNTAANPAGAQDLYVDAAGNVQASFNAGLPLTPLQAQQVAGLTKIAPGQTWNGQGFEGWGMSRGANMEGMGRASRIGVKGSEDLGNGLKAIYQVEFGINLNDTDNAITDNNDGITYRNTFVGLAGNWGTALVGRHDTPLKISTAKLDLFADTMADYNGTVGFQDIRADNAVAYVSPSWAGFQLAAAIVPAGGATALGAENINSDSLGEAYSLAAIYSNGPFYASVAYENLGKQLLMDSATSLVGNCGVVSSPVNVTINGTTQTIGYQQDASCNQWDADWTKWRVGLGLLDWNGFTLTGIYEHHDLPNLTNAVTYTGLLGTPLNTYAYDLPIGVGAAGGSLAQYGYSDKADLWQVQAAYAFGNFQLKAMYGEMERSGDYVLPDYQRLGLQQYAAYYNNMADKLYNGTRTTWAVGADYNFSKRTKIYALYTQVNDDLSSISNLATTNLTANNMAVATPSSITSVSDWDGFSLGLVHEF